MVAVAITKVTPSLNDFRVPSSETTTIAHQQCELPAAVMQFLSEALDEFDEPHSINYQHAIQQYTTLEHRVPSSETTTIAHQQCELPAAVMQFLSAVSYTHLTLPTILLV